MEQRFPLVLTNRWKATSFVLATIVVALATMGLIGFAAALYPLLGIVGLGLWFAGLWVLPERLGKKVAYSLATATLDETGLTVCYETTGTVQHLAFADMVSYSTYFNSGLTIRPRRGRTLCLHLNSRLHPQGMGKMWALINAFESIVAAYQRQHPQQPQIANLGFLERPAGAFWLVVFATFVGWLGWRAGQPLASEGTWGGFLFASLLLTIYALAWRHARMQWKR
ncbi:hypothetical protein [Hymenobacter properus]|uniref:Uncharacterized protein n=1 Tax=Hymenobacter properus TaxID=2791026 RepID=A0A931FHE9_9BACT|nr:hypothetical protein [Hymenobacter properus]MBF9140997.1 hypothetical protein [Hymenobacter properus]MBR7719806.1 hypothetical protein [Microvirga sp. SRT04]